MKSSDYKYKTTFSSKISKIFNEDLERHIAIAGLDRLKKIMPPNVNLQGNPDLIGIVANAAVVGVFNKNDDGINKEAAVEIADNWIWKLVNLEHNRSKIVGVICNASFSRLDTNEVLTKEEALGMSEPFNISLAFLLYKSALSDDFLELLEECVDEGSDKYGQLSLSWELLFNNYEIVKGSKLISEASPVEFSEEADKALKMNGGNGIFKDERVYRLIKPPMLIPLGVGIVEHPAAPVKGMEVVAPQDNKPDSAAEIEIEIKIKPESKKEDESEVEDKEMEDDDEESDALITRFKEKYNKLVSKIEDKLKNGQLDNKIDLFGYGFCPICDEYNAEGSAREKCLNGNTTCGNCKKTTPSKEWMSFNRFFSVLSKSKDFTKGGLLPNTPIPPISTESLIPSQALDDTKKTALEIFINKGNLTQEELYNLTKDGYFSDFSNSLAKKDENDKKNTPSISQTQNNDVKDINSNIIHTMKIESLKQLNDEVLKTAKASDIQEAAKQDLEAAVNSALQAASEKYVAEKDAKEKEIAQIKASLESMTKEKETSDARVQDLTTRFNELAAAEQARANQELFTQRMAALDEEFELDSESREVLAADIRELVDDESFSKYMSKMQVMMRDKKKKKKDMAKEGCASTSTAGVVDAALKNSEKDKQIPNGSQAQTPTLKEKLEKSFKESVTITI